MSNAEVGSTVSAIISAFRGAADQVKDIKKRSWRHRGEQDVMESILRDSFLKGEAEIQQYYSTGYHQFGYPFKRGDGEFIRHCVVALGKYMSYAIVFSSATSCYFRI